jgi:hypothetical protein
VNKNRRVKKSKKERKCSIEREIRGFKNPGGGVKMRWRIFLALCLFIIVFGQSYETGRTGSHCDKMGAVFSGSFDQAFNYLTTTMDGFHNTFNV